MNRHDRRRASDQREGQRRKNNEFPHGDLLKVGLVAVAALARHGRVRVNRHHRRSASDKREGKNSKRKNFLHGNLL
jgi:hypothetical protein